MDVFGHVGLTLAAAYAGDHLVLQRLTRRPSIQLEPAQISADVEAASPAWSEGSSSFSLDYRLVIVGAMLPDIIDKPLAIWVAPDLVNHSLRSLGHSAVFSTLLLAIFAMGPTLGMGRQLAVLGASSLWHLLMDQMWRQSEIALWPFIGLTFPPGPADLSDWTRLHVRDLLTFYSEPPELIGAIVILLFAISLTRPLAFRRFLRSGTVA